MINIYKFQNDMWVFIEQCDELTVVSRLADLRLDGNTYTAELQTISGAETLEV